MAFIKTSQHTSKWDSVGLHQGKKGNISKSKVGNWMSWRRGGRKKTFTPASHIFWRGWCVAPRCSRFSPAVASQCRSSRVQQPQLPYWDLHMPHNQALEATWSQQPGSPDTTELLFTICVMCQFRSISGGLTFSQSITEWSLISVSTVLILSHVSYLLQQYF